MERSEGSCVAGGLRQALGPGSWPREDGWSPERMGSPLRIGPPGAADSMGSPWGSVRPRGAVESLEPMRVAGTIWVARALRGVGACGTAGATWVD